MSFFTLYPRAIDDVLGPNFRDSEFLFRDRTSEPSQSAPQLIIVEPTYEDAPHIGSDHPNDNHAPLAVGWGEEFLRRTYEAVSADRARWEKTVMVVYYDEHGGFWDHVPPPLIPYTTTGSQPKTFTSLGPRIPGLVISPLVDAGAVYHETLDHTSVLQFLAEVFTPGQPYSAAVDARRAAGVASLSAAITLDTPRTTPPAPPDPIRVTSVLGDSIVRPPASEMGQAFEHAARELLANRRLEVAQVYPELLHWEAAVRAARG
jgi:phospholipase C